jgi:hypothetical protein
MNTYFKVSDYLYSVRNMLQDLVGPPYRYSDQQIVDALNTCVGEISRIRPDIFLEYKYQFPLPHRSARNDMTPGLFLSTRTMDVVPIPRTYFQPSLWYIEGLLQLFDVDDTQDVRAQAFFQKFLGTLMSAAA